MSQHDVFERDVPPHLAPAFRGRQAVLRTMHELFDCEQHIMEAIFREPSAGSIDTNLIGLLFDLIRREVGENLPAYGCRRCSQRPNPQCHCRGKGWLTQRETSVPGAVRRLYASEEP